MTLEDSVIFGRADLPFPDICQYFFVIKVVNRLY
jgi:hypothetical protein